MPRNPIIASSMPSSYGSIPILPSTNTLSSNVLGILNNAIPGYSGLSKSASSIVGNALNGQLSPDVQRNIQDTAAAQAVQGGMPGSNMVAGSLFGNKTLRDVGLTTMDTQQKGFGDLISFLGANSGTTAPTFGQQQEQSNAAAQYAAAPNPAAAANERERLYAKYSIPKNNNAPWWQKPGQPVVIPDQYTPGPIGY